MIDQLKKLNKGINDLWHSKNKDYKNMGFGSLIFFVISLFVFLIAWRFNTNNNIFSAIIKIFLIYLTVAFLYISFAFLFTYIYVYGILKSNNSGRVWRGFNRFIYKVFLAGIIIEIPLLIILKIMEFIINCRAKKVDNIINLLFILIFNIIVLSLLFNYISKLTLFLTERVYLMASKYDIMVNENFVGILIFFFLIKLLIDLISCGTFKFLKVKKTREIQKNIYKLKVNLNKKILSSDIKENFEKKREILEENKKESNERLEYDLDYHKKSIWRLQLTTLIFFYIYVATVDGDLTKIASETKDAITVITLFMLYWDKRKDWK